MITGNVAQYSGGGIELQIFDPIQIGNTLVARNWSGGEGGGMDIFGRLYGGPLVITNAVVIDNWAAASGSGIYLDATSVRMELTHVTLARNSGGDGSGVYITGTIRSDGSVLPPELAATLWMTNIIVAEQNVGVFAASNQRVVMDSILWHSVGQPANGAGVYTVTHAFEGDPRLGADGYHLMAGSAAIDRGVVTDVDIDIDGTHRPQGLAPDLGADEWEWKRYFYLPNIRR